MEKDGRDSGININLLNLLKPGATLDKLV